MGRGVLKAALEDVGRAVEANKIRHGWKITRPEDWSDPHEVLAVLMLITTEVAEAAEAVRVDDRENFEEELADIFIRTVGLAHGMNIDLGAAVWRKIEKNKVRPIRHGGKRV